MNKTAQTELHRLFLIDRLPEPLSTASSHLQIFDNYIPGTRLRIREVRDPSSNAWTRILQQHFPFIDGQYAAGKLAEIYLNNAEFALFERFKGREIRKNRYFHEFDGVMVAFDVYLGPLLGLHTAKIQFEDRLRMEQYQPPRFAAIEVTDLASFSGENLVDASFADIQAEVSRLERSHP